MINRSVTIRYKNFFIQVKEILEGFITGLHKSPFHGFSSEFSEYKQYFKGDDVKNIDWKLYGKTDRLFIKKYQEETNIKCHFIIDNSSSMHYPEIKDYYDINNLNKLSFSIYAAACMMEILKKQQDAIGLSIYSENLEFYLKEKTSPKHYSILFSELESRLKDKTNYKGRNTETYKILHYIAEKLDKKSLVIIFTDLVDSTDKDLMEALKHLKYNNHKVILFHVFDKKTELKFDIENKPTVFIDLETNQKIKVRGSHDLKDIFENTTDKIFKKYKLELQKYNIDYVGVDINNDFNFILEEYLVRIKKKIY